MPDTADNRGKLAQFVAQEVRKDGKIPHFSPEAVGYYHRRGPRARPARRVSLRAACVNSVDWFAPPETSRDAKNRCWCRHNTCMMRVATSRLSKSRCSESDATSWSTVLG